ncbi:MAG: adenylate/guanylate cyclase domain-containing protein [Ignavibacteriaceae bacterium]|jgi:adenylate cyclase|nr:adenylate/guanylate cyclase domain-containing protein [Ignavibacteriaceae bacterium]MCW8824218.1 adenylate/guanylate cyclase domain-containing protein [Ignavibacteriaceae bacterium]MCW8961466.1 adenylate/guanylate cyclase domain-containing protein [Ignavibacteriaceae bacterium]MCW8996794.1 adenylate/guanylate cyclase domain-containing protein [Psychromonas sp.]MCW9097087.1 adenylate/guanylate cyclase domain-containing protein [Ignavibacteriaceae bacterium]
MFVTRKYKLKNVSYYSIIGTVVGAGIGLALQYIDRIEIYLPTIRGMIIGLLVGTIVGICEEFLFLEKFRKKSYLFLLLFRTVVYSAVFAFFELSINSISKFFISDLSLSESIYFAFYKENYLRDLGIITFISVLAISLIQIKRLHRPGDLLKYITGKYHRPEEIDKIFLFIDLNSSTAIAEKIGNIKYSSFLIDYYHDMTGAILMSKAEIYQYIGDEIVLTWSLTDGIKHSRCINCFFDIKNNIELNKESYLNKYGVYPQFKAALHAGKVSVTWIGSIKKEIVYHGDVLNTTSRIQDECNKHNQCFLISNYILENIKVPEYLKSEFVGELQLKGKQKKVKIYGLKGITED